MDTEPTEKATEGPWSVHPRLGHICVPAGEGCRVIADVCGQIGDRNPDARLIVTAVNAHEELVEALRWLLLTANTENDVWNAPDARSVAKARAALRKAGIE